MPELLESLFEWTLRNSLAGGLLILLSLVVLALFGKRLSLPVRFVIWSVVALRLLMPVELPSEISVFNLLPEPPAKATAAPALVEVPPSEDPFLQAALASSPAQEVPSKSLQFELLGVGALIWLAVAFGILLRNLWGHYRMARYLDSRPLVQDAQLRRCLLQCSQTAGVPIDFSVVSVPAGQTVAIFGFLRPTHLLIPEDLMNRCTEVRGILFHELGHVRRRDLLWNWIALLLQAMHWFNPMVWLAVRSFRADQELSCDEVAVRQLPKGQRRDYGEALLKMAAYPLPARQPALIPFFPHQSEIKKRLLMIAKPQTPQAWIQMMASLVILALCAFTFTSATADEKPGGAPSPEASADKKPSAEAGVNRDGDGNKTAPKDGEGTKTGPRDGEGTKTGPRDGEGTKTGPKDGEGATKPEGSKDPNAPAPAFDSSDPKYKTQEGKIFLKYDKDGNGGVSAEEAAGMTEKEESRREMRDLEKIIEKLDVDGKEKLLNFEEFQAWRKMRASGRG